jgi:23S rRNA (cytidine1920-2'-O)/16S rRNA (cytidine1409-2'-O)-methyltransferase
LKERIDVLMVQRGLVPSREKAQAYIMAGSVEVGGLRELKPGTKYAPDAKIQLLRDPVPYVSRGGLKLEAAVDAWGIAPAGLVCVDIGASTGGFTDLMLGRGAARVYAIDVGYGQLDYTLRNDPRVVNMERTNIRYLSPSALAEQADFITIDVSFISLALVLPAAVQLLKEGGRMVALIKPQFEAERGQVGKGGIVRDEAVHEQVVQEVRGYAAKCGLAFAAVMESPVRGTKGNREFLALLRHLDGGRALE